jgi:hypothetical protein
VIDTNWKNYGLQQPRGALPIGPMVVFVHIASVWVPFTSESKEAIASYDEIRDELRLALMECGRKLGTHVRKGKKLANEFKKRNYIDDVHPARRRSAEGHPEARRARREEGDREPDHRAREEPQAVTAEPHSPSRTTLTRHGSQEVQVEGQPKPKDRGR